jgi:hypothetical protein
VSFEREDSGKKRKKSEKKLKGRAAEQSGKKPLKKKQK